MTGQQNFSQLIGLIAAIGICFAAAGIGALFTTPAIANWYATLNKPAWNPPNWIFGPVWSTLYLLMAIAAWLVWREWGFKAAGLALALVEIIFLWLAILATIFAFRQLNTLASMLLLPYILWVTFAAFLNYTIWKLNS